MRNAIPPSTEQAAERTQRLRHAHDRPKKQRWHMRSRLLGVHRHTMGRWLAIYAAGGLAALLATYVPAGKPVSRAPAGLASLEPALRRPAGVASDEARRPWVRRTPGVEVKDQTRYTLVRPRVKAQLNVARPRHTPQPGRPGGLPGERSRPPAAGPSARPYPSQPGVQSSRTPRRLGHQPPPAPPRAWRATRRTGPARLPGVLLTRA
jgi:hypothetical protein